MTSAEFALRKKACGSSGWVGKEEGAGEYSSELYWYFLLLNSYVVEVRDREDTEDSYRYLGAHHPVSRT